MRCRILAMVAFLVWTLGQSALAQATPPTPIPAEQAAALAGLRPDPKPPKLIRDVHYSTSNEAHIGLFSKVAAQRGGIQIGVGAEQNYLLAGWGRPDLLICMDFDQYIADIHVIYGLLLKESATSAELIEWWQKERKEKFLALLETRVADAERRKVLARIHRREGPGIARHLGRLTKRFEKQQLATWLTDPEQFTFVRQLWGAGRVIPVRGDLTGPDTMQDIGAFARKFNMPIRLFYLSNAEYYFKYWDGAFRANVASLPFDDRSVVLHTHPTKTDYMYYYHTGANFAAWAAHTRVKWFRTVKHHADKTEEELLFTVTKLPEDVIKPRPKKGPVK